jgi:hypothetical protein
VWWVIVKELTLSSSPVESGEKSKLGLLPDFLGVKMAYRPARLDVHP